jgi:multiple sugar transport system permease protein
VSARAQRAVLLGPAAAGALALIAIPALATFAFALFEADLLGPSRYAGLGNFSELLSDPFFGRALVNSLAFAAIAVPLRLAAATGFALLLARDGRGVGAGRTAVYSPSVVPDIAWAVLWFFLLNPLYGPVNILLGVAGLPEPAWLTEPAAAFAAIVILSAFTVGEGFIVALAARKELPGELYEAARLEGASPSHVLRRVTLPLMAPTLALLAVRDAALTLQVSFTPAYLLTDGGPDRATLFLPLYVYDVGFEQLRYGYGAAMTVSLFALTVALVAVGWWMLRRRRLGFNL